MQSLKGEGEWTEKDNNLIEIIFIGNFIRNVTDIDILYN